MLVDNTTCLQWFSGMSINSGKLVAPALQVLLGGGILGDGKGRFSDKVIRSQVVEDQMPYVLS
jgi:sulfite reductase (ferredoxin)